MSATIKCPKCGLVQERRVIFCNACRAVLVESVVPGSNTSMDPKLLTWSRQRIIGGLICLLVFAWIAYSQKTPPEIARRQLDEDIRRQEAEVGKSLKRIEEMQEEARRQGIRESREREERVIEVDPRVLSCSNAKSEAEHLRQLRRADQRIAYCESLIEIEKAGGPRLPW